MQQDQNEFETKIVELQNEVSNFEAFTDFGSYEDIATKARALNDKLGNATYQAKQYNKNENMTMLEETSYENIKEMMQ